ncbi:MFS transporter [Aurantiacibacter sp. MUD11]|uniref:MFS transporter n=1 Tax=Aurantiacibacter sp. MUD11 TaxID=3003265 RepID=UPI0022AB08B4|nr:MFS transporter [Aurantiacibacter sp. MUD11]WAT18574.1 MFS transporter [Aurantiacibacter sp. MUD11]
MVRSTTFAPLAHGMFALLMAGVLLANLGNSIQSVGASWQLTADGQPADVVALVQTALNLPILLLALPAGAWADMHDRRRVILTAQATMLVMSLLLAALAWSGNAPAWAIIVLTALLACGIATMTPATGASIRSTVPATQLAAAVALNILIFNTARAVGPAIGGGIVAAGGASAAFLVNAGCYVVAIALFLRWRPKQEPVPEARPLGAMVAEGLRHAFASKEIRTILLRALAFTMAGAAAWALMPLVADRIMAQGPSIYGLLLGALGLGAVIGAASATWFRQRFSAEAITCAAGVIYGLAVIAVSLKPGLVPTLALLVIGGAGWVQALSGFSVAAQLWAPQAVVGRTVALASAVTFGGLAAGAWLWGHYAEEFGVAGALLASGGAMVVLPLLGLVLPMPAHQVPTRS